MFNHIFVVCVCVRLFESIYMYMYKLDGIMLKEKVMIWNVIHKIVTNYTILYLYCINVCVRLNIKSRNVIFEMLLLLDVIDLRY